MRLELKKFGEFLISRPAGHEAFLVFCSSFKPKNADEIIELDFTGVKVLAPSWADEFISSIKEKFKNRVTCLPSDNASVTESLKFLR